MLNIADRVELTQTTLMDDAGAQGVIVAKYVPAHAPCAWDITVRWDGNQHDTRYCYPGAPLRAVAATVEA